MKTTCSRCPNPRAATGAYCTDCRRAYWQEYRANPAVKKRRAATAQARRKAAAEDAGREFIPGMGWRKGQRKGDW